MIATKKPYSNSKSGIRGVFFNKQAKKWQAKLMCQGVQRNLGFFETIEEAAKARARAEEEIFGPILERYGK